MNRLLISLFLVGAFACDCGDGTLGGVEVGFRVSGDDIDFGRVEEETRVTREVELVSDSRADVEVAVRTEGGPFLTNSSILVPAGATARLSITYVAGTSKEAGRLLLGPEDKKVVVRLFGEGVEPLDCQPSQDCRKSVFDLATNSCIESPGFEGQSCIPLTACLENGTCRSGECSGTARTCADQNLCTIDGCHATTGCVNTPRTCPTPTNPCLVATCDPQTGCGVGFAQDGILCGSVDCINVHMCISGVCSEVATPEGFLCSPPTPCQGEGRCRQQVCTRPDAGEMAPEFSAVVPGKLAGDSVVAHSGNLYFDVCEVADGGCELLSYTPTGFLRFNRGHGDAAPRSVQFAADSGVVVNDGTSLEGFALANGSPLWRWSADASIPSDSVVLLGDGGIAALTGSERVLFDPRGDGGDTRSPAAPGALAAYSSDTQLSWSTDAGLHIFGFGTVVIDAGLEVLVVNVGHAFVGGSAVFAPDGGVVFLDWSSVSPPRTPIAEFALASAGIGYAFATSCEPPAVPACLPEELQTEVRAFSLSDGSTKWQSRVLPAQVSASLEQAAAVDLLGGAIITVADITAADGGYQTFMQLFVNGSRAYSCPLPSGGRIQGAVFDRSRLFVVMDRGGASRLEAYDLKGLPISTSGWPQRHGVSGTRRER